MQQEIVGHQKAQALQQVAALCVDVLSEQLLQQRGWPAPYRCLHVPRKSMFHVRISLSTALWSGKMPTMCHTFVEFSVIVLQGQEGDDRWRHAGWGLTVGVLHASRRCA